MSLNQQADNFGGADPSNPIADDDIFHKPRFLQEKWKWNKNILLLWGNSSFIHTLAEGKFQLLSKRYCENCDFNKKPFTHSGTKINIVAESKDKEWEAETRRWELIGIV